ncbi:hypothetical protein PPL_06357 [Heterostelium album PN500]|uniref:Uncharacterized protein n=1 Tax=Heterostelium pallidum (strain ATCC 26659 / Pp 5 / PN500) TaxID=670386 RepID=D3BCX9_HETP5|nr:hypothetical protein PPL_06357 [Heterostelium album PN500]EFA80771.1 hypothetical protein PPL_06357 [Heterostelium album PN500]|eukprot:XP_020432890.1 hypothetical protein PPL_06357 [Heterostelium album PN500]
MEISLIVCIATAQTIEYCQYCNSLNECDSSSPLNCVNIQTSQCTAFSDPCGTITDPFYVYVDENANPTITIQVFGDAACQIPITSPTPYTCVRMN